MAKFVTAKEECWKRDGLGHWAIMLKAQFTNCMRSLSTIWSEASDFSRKNIQTCAEGAQDPLNPLTLVGGGSVYVPFEIKGKDHHGSQAISGMAVQDRPTRPGAAATGRSRAFGGIRGICFPGCDRSTVWVKIAGARIAAHREPYRVARHGVCDGINARDAGRHSMRQPAPPCRACTARTGGLPLEPVLPMGRRFVLRQNVAGLPSIPPSVGGTAFSPQKTRKHAGSRALWKLMKPVFCKAKRANETLRARRVAGEARPPNEVCRMNRFRSWLPLTAAGRQSVWFCLRSMSIRCGLLSDRSWTRISFW